jgi:hypothetical protein
MEDLDKDKLRGEEGLRQKKDKDIFEKDTEKEKRLRKKRD